MNIEVTSKSKTIKYYSQIARLIRSVWPCDDPSNTIDRYIETLRNYNKGKFERHILLFDCKEIVGYARIFGRKICTGKRYVNNMGLSDVCVKREYRGQGFGHQIVRQAFEFVDSNKFDCSIFQTKVPDFYIKLGAQMISNAVVNCMDIQIKPFKDPYVMLYPQGYYIGDEKIDLNGSGY